jgi:hypothetical protein
MAINRSRGLVEALAGKVIAQAVAATIALNENGASPDTIVWSSYSSSGFITAGFGRGQVDLFGSDNEDGQYQVQTVAAGTLTLPAGMFTGSEIAGNTLTIEQVRRGSLRDLFYNSTLRYYTGTRPASGADGAETGTLLGTLTGIYFGDVQFDSTNKYAYIELRSGLNIASVAVAEGDIGYARFYSTVTGAIVTGASTTSIRMDLSVGVGSGDLQLSGVGVKVGDPIGLRSAKMRVKQVV